MSRPLQLALILVNVAFWGAILGWTAFADHPYDPPDHLDDPAFASAAEPLCAEAQAAVVALGGPTEVATPEDRAQLVDDGNLILREMLTELGTLPSPTGEEAGWVTQWLADWAAHVDDRQRWADSLRAGRDGPFTETARGAVQLSRVIDNFAEVNLMESCKTSGDV
ncbi:MAG: hypothetical protein H0W25_15845 [Acidimicrobiia bacterium]|nr:hypothetical protein [Acidimicrobiia bacterium]